MNLEITKKERIMNFAFFILAMLCLLIGLATCFVPRVPSALIAWLGMFIAKFYGSPIDRHIWLPLLIIAAVIYILTLLIPKWFPSPDYEDSLDALRTTEPLSRKAYIINMIINLVTVVTIIVLTIVNIAD